MEIFYGLIVLSLSAGLGWIGSQLVTTMVKFFNIPLDYITLVFMMYNFLVGGILITFYKGPLWLQQIYLIILSSLMAYNFSELTPLATWILLGLLAVWDLIAVLCPFGPLKLLIEHSKKENIEIQGLLYASMLF
jgi:presenilin 1